ncbi:MAG: B12-binding domain-containing protein [Deltaproteobacteria bacterium]|nr:B12-binding domain-containing protein [Deltaproteobacteria bacterium]
MSPAQVLPTNDRDLLKNFVIEGRREGLDDLLDRLLKETPPLEIINNILLEAMKVVGDLFGKGEMQLPFVLESAEVMKKSVDYLNRFMEKSEARNRGTIVLATVRGDVHDIGKNLVDIILTNNGYRVINLGIKQPIENILAAFGKEGADAIGLSGLLVKSTIVMREDLEEMERRGLKAPVICGGAALTRRYVEEDLRGIYSGAVYYGKDAFSGLEIMNEIISSAGRSGIPSTNEKKEERKSLATGTDSEIIARKISIDEKITPVEIPPMMPFRGVRLLKEIDIYEVAKYLNEVALFKGQWQFKQGKMSREKYEDLLKKKVRPLFRELLGKYGDILRPQAAYGYFTCNSDGNDVIVYDENDAEAGRFSFPRQRGKRGLCISDYFLPLSSGRRDVLALQSVTMGQMVSEVERELFSGDRYTDYLYLHGLGVELAEALAEYAHATIRRELMISGEDSPEISGILKKQYRGCRYSFGYPACPDLSQQETILKLLRCDEIGISLTEEFQLVPEQSSTAIVVHHPAAVYFDIS